MVIAYTVPSIEIESVTSLGVATGVSARIASNLVLAAHTDAFNRQLVDVSHRGQATKDFFVPKAA